jgi:hypothetical protein
MKWWMPAVAAAFLAIHIAVLKFSYPSVISEQFGASAATVTSRPWAQFTALWFHNSWGHIGYNLAILLALWPVTMSDGRGLAAAFIASPLAGFTVNLLIILPLASLYPDVAEMGGHRLIGASMVIFAGVGIGWAAWDIDIGWKIAAVAGFVTYEATLGFLAVTQPFVAVYHIVALGYGLGFGAALR